MLITVKRNKIKDSKTASRMMAEQAKWRHFQHEADIGVVGVGDTPAAAFAQAALAMTAVITDPETVIAGECFNVECQGIDLEYLFVDWLNALVYEMAVRKMLFSQFDVEIKDHRLKARVCGEKVDRHRHQPAVEVKGATLTELKVYRGATGQWLAQCVVDV